MFVNFSADTAILGSCEACEKPTSHYRDCGDLGCRDFVLLCDACVKVKENLRCHSGHTRGRSLQHVG